MSDSSNPSELKVVMNGKTLVEKMKIDQLSPTPTGSLDSIKQGDHNPSAKLMGYRALFAEYLSESQ